MDLDRRMVSSKPAAKRFQGRMVGTVFILVLVCIWPSSHAEVAPNLMQLSNKYFFKEGDLNIGAIYHIHSLTLEKLCGKDFSFVPLHTNPHILHYTVETINRRQDILPNITLGYVILDDCERDIPSIPRMLQLMPLTTDKCPADDGLTVGKNFDVVGMLGTTSSDGSALLATMAGFFQMPQIGAFASSDKLSDTALYPNYFRLLPPDKFQAKATVDFVKAMGWTYVSILYIEADYGYNGNKNIQKFSNEAGVCIEETYAVNYDFGGEDYERLLRQMTTNRKAKVMIVYLFPSRTRWLLTIYNRIHSELGTKLIWILPECFPWGMTRGIQEPLVGSIQVTLPNRNMPGFLDYYEGRTPWNTLYDPWIGELWQQLFDCSFDQNDGKPNCEDFPSMTDSRKYFREPLLQRWSDGVHVYAHALDSYIRDNCPDAFSDKTKLKGCVKPWLLTKYIKNVEVERDNEIIKFDGNGDWLRTYIFGQVRYNPQSGRYVREPIATYDTATEELVLDYTAMAWDKNNETSTPESVCAYPCQSGEIMIQGEVICCWDCYKCRDNEIVSENMTKCVICTETTWPNTNSTECEPIPQSYLSYTHVYGVGMLSLGLLGVVMSVAAIVLVVRHRDRRVIKGASPDMLMVILFGALLSGLTVPTFILKPEDVWCYLSRAGFSLSCTFMFTPLLVKTLRIHRIFTASKRLQTEIGFVTRLAVNSQASLIILTQIIVTVVLAVIWPPSAVVRMPIRTEKYVELQCDLETYGIVVPLSYNMLILLLCSILGLLTRKLPDNFNESWYIFVTVCTTLFIWIAFLPTYFSAFYAFHKAVLLSLAVFLNAFMVQVCLFGPKVYALFYVADKEIKITNFTGSLKTASTDVPSSFTNSIKKAPDQGKDEHC